MGILDFLKTKGNDKSKQENNAAELKLLRKEIDTSPHKTGSKWTNSTQETVSKAERQGLDVSIFTQEKIQTDAQQFVDEHLRGSHCFAVNIGDAIPHIVVEPLTKTGKLQKNVIRASMNIEEVFIYDSGFGFEVPKVGDYIICYIAYLSDGNVNSIDYHFWKNHIKHSVKVRNHSNSLFITEVSKLDSSTQEEVILFKEKDPTDNVQGGFIFESSLKKSFQLDSA